MDDIDKELKIEDNKKIVFNYLTSTIEVLTEHHEFEDGKEVDWHRLSKHLSMEMLESIRHYTK